MSVRLASSHDIDALVVLRSALWPDDQSSHRSELSKHFTGEHSHIDQVLLYENDEGEPLGFVELRVRNYAEGSEEHAVPFLEGWYVSPDHRRQGVGRALIKASEEWARARGFDELASNSLLENTASLAAHEAVGFEEMERTVNYLKDL
ncbi:MAG: GNAT family N-acetyltransferase [Halioglobus sp.]|nr:GNAT family N-acetyltransferase [Halioglobus sp.]